MLLDMPLEFNDNDIIYAEKILFGRENVFDEERCSFIKNLNTIDLLAVPGSGKTTALLAKLAILSKYSSFDGKGILVLSHTNTAVDLIKHKLGSHCHKLFEPPNFIGTIQSFVNTFLAIPYFEYKYKCRPSHVEAEIFNTKIRQAYDKFFGPSGFHDSVKKNARRIISATENLLENYRLEFDSGQINVTNGIGGNPLSFNKPGPKGKKYVDFNTEEKQELKKWFVQFRLKFWMRYKMLHYDDAYFFAKAYVNNYPVIKEILRHRFNFVFVDEMQDMDLHQVNLLDDIFYHSEENICFQRIGDKNQAIFSYDVKLEEIWHTRNVISLNRSLRLSSSIAEKVQPLALEPIAIVGDNEESNSQPITPTIIVYNDDSIERVIVRFAQLIEEFQGSEQIPTIPKHLFKVIGWRKSSDEQSKITIKNYFPSFNSEKRRGNNIRHTLNDQLKYCCSENITSREIVNSIYTSLITILSIEEIFYSGRNFSKATLRAYLLMNYRDFFQEFELLVYSVFSSLIGRNIILAKESFTDLVTKLLRVFSIIQFSQESSNYIGGEDFNRAIEQPNSSQEYVNSNSITYSKDITIHIETVHSVKGETHCATLYLETYFNKSFESQRLIEQLIGNQINNSEAGIRVKQSARIAYVGFSRPTHFLCLAIHNNRLLGYKERLRTAGWDIDETLVEPN